MTDGRFARSWTSALSMARDQRKKKLEKAHLRTVSINVKEFIKQLERCKEQQNGMVGLWLECFSHVGQFQLVSSRLVLVK